MACEMKEINTMLGCTYMDTDMKHKHGHEYEYRYMYDTTIFEKLGHNMTGIPILINY